ncbi:MAG: acylphosphatase [Acidobacteriota bacterium]
MERVRIFISGRVQGVLFRDFAQRMASSLGVTGWVKNLPDSRVEVLAEGKEEKINQLIESLRQGPQLARVEDLDVKREEYKGEYSGFHITW